MGSGLTENKEVCARDMSSSCPWTFREVWVREPLRGLDQGQCWPGGRRRHRNVEGRGGVSPLVLAVVSVTCGKVLFSLCCNTWFVYVN